MNIRELIGGTPTVSVDNLSRATMEVGRAMKNMTIADLPMIDVTAIGDKEPSFIMGAAGTTGRVTMRQLADAIIGNMGVAVIKCKHCGQWGARFCECRKCGAPIE